MGSPTSRTPRDNGRVPENTEISSVAIPAREARGCRYPDNHRIFANKIGSTDPTRRYSHPTCSQVISDRANTRASTGVICSSKRTSMTTADPSTCLAKKSGTCVEPSFQWKRNGCEATPTTLGEASSSISWSRSSHDSCPTCSPVVANHHIPGKFRCPRKLGKSRT